MNKKLYRLVFNASRGCLVAVSESALRKNKSSGRRQGAGMGSSAIVVLRLAATFALGLSTLSSALAQAQIMPDPAAPGNQRPTVLSTSNEVPLVNIQTPSAAGVSRNTYEQFDVGAPGAVLNNSRTDVQTQLGGWVQGNPWLAKGEAHIILNEVNSNNPSQLQGFIEIGGQRAEIIIANPAGIEVDGAGFINASRATLTTGSPLMNGGSLEGYRVQRGTISIGGKGLDASLVDYTGILARAIEVNANIHAQELDLITGENTVDANSSNIQQISGADNAPAFALDVSELGGMYAGQIRLVGTEVGVGVRHHGTMAASAGDIHIDTNGQLSSTGAIQANQGDIAIRTAQDQSYSGSVLAGENLTLHSGGNHQNEYSDSKLGTIKNSGVLRAGQEANLRAGDLNNSGRVDAQRLDIEVDNLSNSGDLWQSGAQNLNVQANHISNEQDGFLGRAVTTPAQDALSSSQPSEPSVQIPGRDIKSSPQDPDSQSPSQPDVGTEPPPASLESGVVNVSGRLENHAEGTLAAEGDLYVSAEQSLSNAGHVRAKNVQSSGDWFENTSGTLQSDRLNVKVNTVKLTGGSVSADTVTLNSIEHIQGSAAQLYAKDELHLNAEYLSNAGEIQSGDKSQISVATSLTNTGTIAAADDLNIEAASVDSSGTLAAGLNEDGSLNAFDANGAALRITTSNDLVATGTNLAAGTLTLNGDNVDLSESQTSAFDTHITARGDIDTWQANVVTQENLLLRTDGALDNTKGPLASQQGDLSIQALSLSNAQGELLAGKNLSIALNETLSNTDGTVYAGKNATLDITTLTNTGTIAAADDLTIDVASIDSSGTLAAGLNSDGSLKPFDANGAELRVTATGELSTSGTNLVAGALTLNGDHVDLSDSQTSAYRADIAARGDLATWQASIVAQESLSLQSGGALDNTDGTLSSEQGDLSVQVLSLNNTDGTVYAGGNVTLDTGTLTNSGTIAAADDVTISAANVHSSGTLAAGLNQDGTLKAFTFGGEVLDVTTAGDLTATGTNLASGNLTLDGGNVDLSESQTSAFDTHITARGDIDTWKANVVTKENLSLQAGGGLDNTEGSLSSQQGDLSIQALSLSNAQGELLAGKNLSIALNETLSNTDGTVYAGKNATLGTGALTNTGSIAAADNLAIDAASIDSSGTLAAGLKRDGSLKPFDANGAVLRVTTTDDLVATGTNLAAGTLTLDGESVDLSESQTSAYRSGILARGDLASGKANVVAQNDLSLQSGGTLDNTEGTLSSEDGDLRVQALSLNNDQGELLAGNSLEATLSDTLNNTDGSVYAGGSVTLDIGTLASSGTVAAADDVTISAVNVLSSGTLAAGLNQDGTLKAFANDGGVLDVTPAGDLTATGTNLASGNLTLDGGNVDLSESQTSAHSSDIVAQGKLDTWKANVVTQENLTLQAEGAIDNTEGILSSQQGDLSVQALSLNNEQGELLAGDALEVALSEALSNTDGTVYADGNAILNTGALTNTGAIAAADNLTIDAASVTSSGTLAAGLKRDGSLNTFDADGASVRVTTSGDLSATGTNLAAGSLTLKGGNVDLSESQTSAFDAHVTAKGDLASGQANIVTQESLSLQSGGALDNTEGTLSSEHGDLSVQVLSLNNTDGTVYAGGNTTLEAAEAIDNRRGTLYSEQGDLSLQAISLANTEGTVYAGGNAALDTEALTNTGTIAAADNLAIDAASVDSSGTLAAGLNSDGSLNTFDANGAALRVTTSGDLSATGTNLAAGTLTLDGENVDLSESQTSAFDTRITARGDIDTWQANVVTQENLTLQAEGAIDNTAGTLSSQQGDLSVQAVSLNNDQGELLASDALEVALSESLNNTDGTVYAGGNASLDVGELTNTGTVAAADNVTINATIVTSSGTLAAGLNSDGSLNTFDENGAALRVTTSGDLSATGTNLAAGTLTLDGENVDLSESQTSAFDTRITARGDIDTWQANVVTQKNLTLQAEGAIDNTEGTLSSQQGDLSVQAVSLNNEQGELLAGDTLEVALSEALSNTDGTVYAGGNASLDVGGLTNTGTVAAADNVTINATSVTSSGTLAAGLSSDGSLNTFDENGAALRVTTSGDLSATGTNLAAGTLTLDGENVDLSKSQTSAYSSDVSARGDLDTWQANVVTQKNLTLQAEGAIDNTEGTLSSQQGDLSVQAVSLNNEQSELLAGDTLEVTLSESLNNTDGTVYAGGNASLDVGVLTNTGTVAAADDLTIDAASVTSSGTLAAGLKRDGSLNTFDENGAALRVTTSGDLSATGTNLAAGTLTLDGENVDLSESQTSAYRADITARGDLASGQANIVTQESLSLQSGGALDNTEGTLSSEHGDLSVQVFSLNNTDGTVYAGGNTTLEAAEAIDNRRGTLYSEQGDLSLQAISLANTEGTVYAGGNAALDTEALTNTGTIAAADNLAIDAASVDSSGTLAAGLNSDGSLNTFDANGAALRVTTSGDLSATGTNLAAGSLAFDGDNIDLSKSQTSAYNADIIARGDQASRQANVVIQEKLTLQAEGGVDNTGGILSSQQGDLSVQAVSLNNEQGELLAGDTLEVALSEALSNTDGTVYAGGNASLDVGELTNTGTVAAAGNVTINAASIDSTGTLAAGLNSEDGTLKAFAEDGSALSIITDGDLSATGTNIASGNLTLDGDHVDLSKSQTSAYRVDITAQGDLTSGQANVVTQENLTLQVKGAFNNAEGTLSSQKGNLSVQALSLSNEQGELLAGKNLSIALNETLSNTDGTVYAGKNVTLDTDALTNTGTIAAADNLAIDAASVDSSGNLAAGLNSDGSLNTFDENGAALRVTTSGDLSATGTNLAAGTLTLDGENVDLSESQTSAYRADITARGDLASGQANIVIQEDLSLQASGALDNTAGTLSSQVGNLSVQALSLSNEQGELLAGKNLSIALNEPLSNTDGTVYAGGNASLDVGGLTNTGTVAAADNVTINATSVTSSGTLAAGLSSDGSLNTFDENGAALRVTTSGDLSATGTNLAAGTLTLDGENVDLSESQTSAFDTRITARGDIDTWQANVVTQKNLTLQAEGAIDNTEGTLSSQQGDLSVQAVSLNNEQSELLAGDTLEVTLSESLSNTDGTVYAGKNVTLDTAALTNTGTIAAADNLAIDAASVDSSGTLAAGLNSDGSLNTFDENGAALRVTTSGDLSATGTNLAAGTLTLDGENVDLSESQTSAYRADITARGDLASGQANIVTQESLSLQSGGALDNTEGTLSSEHGDLSVQVFSLNNTDGTVYAGGNTTLEAAEAIDNRRGTLYSEQGDLSLQAISLANTEGTVYAGGNAALDTEALTNTGTIAAADNLAIDAASVDSSGTLAAGLNSDGSLNTFDANGAALRVTTSGDLSATGTNLAAGTLTLDGENVDLSESQTSAFDTRITARGDIDTWQANVVTQENLTLQAEGAIDNTAGTLSSQVGDLSVQALSLSNDQGELLAGNALDITLHESLTNNDGTVYAGGNATLDTATLINTGTVAAADNLTINASGVNSSGTLAAGLNSDGKLNEFAEDGSALSVTTTGDLVATGTNLAAGSLAFDGDNIDLSKSQTSAYNADIIARGDQASRQANVVIQEKLTLQAEGGLDNTGGILSSQQGDLTVQALSLNNNQGELIAGNALDITLHESLTNTGGTVYAGGNATLDTGSLTNTGTIAAADDLTIDAVSVASTGTLAAGLNEDGSLNAFDADGAALRVTTSGDLSATGTNLAAGSLTLEGGNVDLSKSQTSAYSSDVSARGDLDTWQANVVTQKNLTLQAEGAIDNTEGTLSSQQGDLSVQAVSLNNEQSELLAGDTLEVTLSESLNNTDGTVYAGGNASLDVGVLTNTGTVAAADDLTIDAASVTSSGTLAAGLKRDGSLNTFDENGAALRVTTSGDLSATGTNLAAGTLTLDGENVDLSESQTSAYRADITARGDLASGQANIVIQEDLSLQASGALDNTAGTLSNQVGNLSVQALSLSNEQGELLAGKNLSIALNETLSNTDGTVYAGKNVTLDTDALTNTGTIAAADNLAIDAASVDSSGTLAAGLNSDGSLNTFDENGAALRVTTSGDLSATGTNLAAGSLTLEGGNVDLSESQTSAFDTRITARGDIDTWQANVVTQENLTLQAEGAIDNTEGTLSSQQGDLSVQALSLNNEQGELLAGDALELALSESLSNTDGTVYAGGNAIFDTGTLINTGTVAAADNLTINAGGVESTGTLAAGLNADGTLKGFAQDGSALNVSTRNDLSATGTNLAAGTLTLDGENLDLSESQTSAYSADVIVRGDLDTWQANVVTQESLTLQIDGGLDNTGGILSSQQGDLSVSTLGLTNEQGTLLAGNSLAVSVIDALSNTDGTIYAGGNVTLDTGSLANTGTVAAAGDLTINAGGVNSSGTLAAGLNSDGKLNEFAEDGSALSVTATGYLVATGTNLAAGSLAFDGDNIDLSESQTSAYNADITARGDMASRQANVVTQEKLTLQAEGGLDNTESTLSSQQGDLTVQALSLDNNQGELLAGNALDITLHESLTNPDGTVYAGGNATLDTGTLVNTGTVAAADNLTINAGGVNSSGTLAAGLNSDGSLNEFAEDGSALSVTAAGDLVATGTNLASGSLAFDGGNIDLSGSQTSAYNADITARGDMASRQANVVTQEKLTLQAEGGLDNTEGTLASQQGDLTVQALSLNNEQGELLAGNALDITLHESLTNTDGTVYAGGNVTLDTGSLANTGTVAAADDLTINAGGVNSSGTLAAGLNSDGKLNEFAEDGSALSVTATDELTATGNNLAVGRLMLDGDNIDLSDSQTSAYRAALAARGDLDPQAATIVTRDSLSLSSDGALDNTQGMLSSQVGDLSIQAQSLTSGQGSVLAGNDLEVSLNEVFANTDGTFYAGGNATLYTGALTNTGTIAAAGGLTIDATSVDSEGALVAGLSSNGSLATFAADGAALRVTASNGLRATGNNFAAGSLTLEGDSVDLNNSQSSAYDADVAAKGALSTVSANLITQNNILIDAQSLNNMGGTVYAGKDAFLRTGALTSTGTLAAADNLTIDATSVDSGGTLAAGLNKDGSLKALGEDGGALSITATSDLRAIGNNLAAGSLTVAGGHVDLRNSQTSAYNADINAQGNLDTWQANVVTQAGLSLQAEDTLNNTDGVLASRAGNLLVDADSVSNTDGLMVAATELDINARKDINNTHGEILAQDNVSLSTDADILNSGGIVQSNALVSLIADTVDNSQTSESTQGIVGKHVQITASNVDNAAGQVLAGLDLIITADTSIINDSGTLNAQRALTLQDSATTPAERNLEISNKEGEIVANNDNATEAASITVVANTVDLSGKLESGSDMALDLVGDLNTASDQQVISEGSLSLRLHGAPGGNTFTNAGKWQGGRSLTVHADEIRNQPSGELRSLGTTMLDTTQAHNGSVINRGLIDGADTQINGHALDNVGTGRLYGDRIAIAVSHLGNREETAGGQTKSATIAARERLDVGAQHITNREGALIFSGGDMAIGGSLFSNYQAVADGTGNAATLNNNSATIESLGDMALAADTLRNTNEHFVMEEEYLGETKVTMIQPQGWENKLTIHENGWVDLFPNGWSKQFDNGTRLTWERNEKTWKEKNTTGSTWNPYLNYEGRYTFYHGSASTTISNWTQYRLKRNEYVSKVVSSAPSLIRAGGNLTLIGNDLLNDKSRIIVGRTLQGDIANLENREAIGERRVITEWDEATAIVRRVSSTKGTDAGVADWLDRAWIDKKHIGPLEEVFTDNQLGVGEVRQNTAITGSGTSIGGKAGPGTASGTSSGSSDVAGATLANQSISTTAQEVAGAGDSASAVNTETTEVTQSVVDADVIGQANSPGSGTNSANAVNTDSHGTTDTSFSAHQGSVTTSGNAVNTVSQGATDTSFSANKSDVFNSAAAINTQTHGADGASVNVAGSDSATKSTHAVNTDTQGANSASFSANKPGNATNSANGVNTEMHVADGASFDLDGSSSATNSTNGVNTETLGAVEASFNANQGSVTSSANGVNTDTHGVNSASVKVAHSGNATNTTNSVNTASQGATDTSFSANQGSATSSANGVNTNTRGANSASVNVAHSGNATNTTNSVNAHTQGATQASFSASQGSATSSANGVNTDTPGANSASLNTTTPSSTQSTAAFSTDTWLLDHANPSQGAQATTDLGTQTAPPLLLPTSSLFTIDPGSNARYLVATDPDFTDHRQWLSSDYLLSALAYDPAHAQKRLGDGFYEQKLIRDQVAALTGYRFLGDYRTDDAQYAALMNAGATFAHEHKLRPGIALSASQTAQLTNDIVWLVTQTVQLPDGSTTTALMPKVYLAPREGDLATNGELLGGHNGTLISARDIDLALSGDLNNSGTIAGRNMVDISAQNLNNSGRIQGDIALIDARQDINIDGGSIAATTGMALQAGGDINIASTLHSATNEVDGNTFSLQGIDRMAGLYVNGEAGNLLASAGGAINLSAAELHNIGSGVTQLIAGSDINLDTLEVGQSHALNWDANNYHHQSHSEEIGSVITGGGAVSLTAGQDINLRAATVDAQGALALNAIDGDITLEAGQRTDSLAEGRQTRSSGLFSSRTRTTRTSSINTQALASELGGQTVTMTSGQDIHLSGANVLADQDLGIHAGSNLTLDAAQHTLSDSHFSRSKKSGLFSGGFGINIGSQRQMTDATNPATFVAPATVGSIGGNVTLSAGDTYTQIGSDVLAPSGDILIGANTVNILEGRETRSSQTEQRFKQSGLSLSLSGPVIDTAQRLEGQFQAAGDTQSPRMQALAAANSALAVTDIQQQLQGGQGTDLSLNISLGSSQSRSDSTVESNTARGSTLAAGGDLVIHALGQGDGEGTLTVQGSQLEAGDQLLLNATQDINLLASADAVSQRDRHNSSSGRIGLGVGTNGIALNLDASRAKGHGNGDSTFFNNTQLSAGNQVILNSGGDTALKSAVVSAPQISTHIGGDLTIESLQDTATHNERHQSSGGSLSVPLIGVGQPTASLNASRTKLNSDFQSVNEQSGLRAGDGGFQVNVGGTTNLTGGAITSTQTAIDEDRNRFTTAGQSASEAIESGALTVSDIANNATYEAESTSVGLSSGGNDSGESSTGLSGIGTGRDDGSASSTTESAISGLAGNQDARTGDADTGIAPIFDAESVRKDVQAQATITQEFGSRASQEGGITPASRKPSYGVRHKTPMILKHVLHC